MLRILGRPHPMGQWLLGSLHATATGVSGWLLALYVLLAKVWPHSGWPGFGLAVGSFGVVHWLIWQRVIAGGWEALGAGPAPRPLKTATSLWLLALHFFQWCSLALAIGYVLLSARHRLPYGIA